MGYFGARVTCYVVQLFWFIWIFSQNKIPSNFILFSVFLWIFVATFGRDVLLLREGDDVKLIIYWSFSSDDVITFCSCIDLLKPRNRKEDGIINLIVHFLYLLLPQLYFPKIFI